MSVWPKVFAILLIGYTLWGRSFAYLGIPSLKLFVGEGILVAFALFKPKKLFGAWMGWLLGRGGYPFIGWSLVLFALYGVLQALRGWYMGHDALQIAENLVFNVYPLYLFFGYWMGKYYPFLLRRVVYFFAYLNALYGLTYLAFLNRFGFTLPWASDVPLFGQPSSSVIAILGILALGRGRLADMLLVAANLVVMLGVQVRGEWLAFAVGLLAWGLLFGRVSRLAALGLVGLILLLVLWALDVRVPAPEHRGGELSVQGVVARILAPINPEAAAGLVGEEAYSFAGTIVGWRVPWWQAIWATVHGSPETAVLGLGYGFPLWSLYDQIPEGVRTPHNAFFYALGYSGWVGVGLFFLFLFSVGTPLFRAFARHSLPEVGLVATLWAGLIASALFGNFFETPFGAIPFYSLMGFGLGLVWRHFQGAHPSAPHPLPAAGR